MTDVAFIIRLATPDDLPALCQLKADIFDHPVKPDRAEEFLNDPRHHLALAFARNEIVGMASAMHYVHPDKDPVMFINEVGVATGYQSRGIGRQLLRALGEHARKLGCGEAWIATEVSNIAAQRAYIAAGGKEADQPFVMYEFDLAETKEAGQHKESS